MTARSWWSLVVLAALAGSAAADPKADIAQKSRDAMASYDAMEYDAAKKTLTGALALAKKARLDRDPVVARVYVALALVALAADEPAAARAALASAVAVDPAIQIEPAYRSPELVKLLDAAKADAGAPQLDAPVDDGVDCASVKGLQHAVVEIAKAGIALSLEALIGRELKPARVAIQYRTRDAGEFTEVVMTRIGSCRYTGQIPASAMRDGTLVYYVAAYDRSNRVIAGSAGAPSALDIGEGDRVTVGGGGGGEQPPPPGPRVPDGGAVAGGVIAGGRPAVVYVALLGGTGLGYVTGNTESGNLVQNCCIGSSLLVLTPELGFHLGRQLSVGIAGRFGLPIGANIEGHATLAPAGIVRVRYTFGRSGEGVRVMAQLGGGVMRHTIKLANAAAGMDTDIVAQGPLLLGAGIGYTRKLAGSLALVADLSALAGIAIVDKLGTATLNSGVGGDVSLGLAFGF